MSCLSRGWNENSEEMQRAGGYSLPVVIPKVWLEEKSNPSEVEPQLGRTRFMVTPIAAKCGLGTEGIADEEGYDTKA